MTVRTWHTYSVRYKNSMSTLSCVSMYITCVGDVILGGYVGTDALLVRATTDGGIGWARRFKLPDFGNSAVTSSALGAVTIGSDDEIYVAVRCLASVFFLSLVKWKYFLQTTPVWSYAQGTGVGCGSEYSKRIWAQKNISK